MTKTEPSGNLEQEIKGPCCTTSDCLCRRYAGKLKQLGLLPVGSENRIKWIETILGREAKTTMLAVDAGASYSGTGIHVVAVESDDPRILTTLSAAELHTVAIETQPWHEDTRTDPPYLHDLAELVARLVRSTK